MGSERAIALKLEVLKAARAANWKKLRALEPCPLIPGALHIIGPKSGPQRAIALAFREGDMVKSWYVPALERREVRAHNENYKRARKLLAMIAKCDLDLLRLRIKARKQGLATQESARRLR